ncbi:Helicase conserved C-terminal domain containing protein, putative [Angomonas deanei]|uniref:Helicase conserved C-terminal domain containing protein, putative n=1 Tax=Angomonas deanei TaxID=59799 RepID=A0A7G2CMS0_9TRYP|nr:Helicase conserved C-terminal domain containing protein, putative [Angomonas deanei]
MINTSGRLLLLDFMMSFFFRCARELSKRKKTKHNHSNDDKDDEKNKHVHKFLIFSSWTLVLDVVESLCSYRRYPYVRLDGNTAVSTRQENIQKFNGAQSNNKNKNNENENNEEEEPPLCFLISKGAGGVGLNLQSADTVFLLDLEYNPARDSQALSRAYRVGQTREVRVFRFYVGEHETERKIKEEFYDKKIVLDEGVVQSGLYDLHSSQKEREAQLQRVLASSRNNNNNENENNKEEVKVPRGVKRSRLTFVDDENENNNNNNPQFCSPSSPTEREIDAFSPTTNPSITDNIHYPQNNNNKRRKTSELLLPSPPVTTTLKEEEELIFNSNSEWYRRLLHEVDTTPYLLALRSTWEAVLPRDEEERGLLNEMLEELEEGANHHH